MRTQSEREPLSRGDRPAHKLGGDLADDAGGGAPALLGEGPRVVGEGGRGWGPVVGGAAAVPELRPVEGAAAGGPAREAVLLRGADAVGRRGAGGAPR